MEVTPGGYSAAQALRSGNRDDVRRALVQIREQSMALAQAWLEHGTDLPRHAWRNPPLWEWGHVAWFQEFWIARNLQRDRGPACDPEHARAPAVLPEADAWYDSSAVPHTTRWTLPLPDAPGTLDYLARTASQTLALLDALPAAPGDEALYFFRLVALHEAMHAEASVYMGRALGLPLPYPDNHFAAVPAGSLAVPAQRFRLGSAGAGFAFDNELEACDIWLDAFEIDAQPVNWDQFMAFVEAGGYHQPQWWTGEGWAWRQEARPSPPAAPANRATAAIHLSAYEAQAWCRWAGRRLPTEAEWECAAVTHPGFRWGQVWEWTASTFGPYPGFQAHPYRDYSAPWFGSRTVLRGAAAATSPWLAHPRYRNFFEPGRTDIFAGFRSCAADAAAHRV